MNGAGREVRAVPCGGGEAFELRRRAGRYWRRVGVAMRLPGSEECVLLGDLSGRRYPDLEAALEELDAQFERAMVGQP